MNTPIKRMDQLPGMAELRAMSNDQLIAALAETMGQTAEKMARLAAIVAVLEDRGVDLSSLKMGMMDQLRLIAHGQLLPEVAARFLAQPMLLSRIAALPLSDQQELVDKGAIKIAQSADDADDVLERPLGQLTRDEIWQVFGRFGVRRIEDQRRFLRAQQARQDRVRKAGPAEEPKVRADIQNGGAWINGMFLSRERLRKILIEIGG